MSDSTASPVRLHFEAIRQDVIDQILNFCRVHGISPTRFGTEFAGDNKLVGSLKWRSVRLETLLKVARRANAYADALAAEKPASN